MSNFETLKQQLLEKAKAKNACSSEYRRTLNANTEEDLLKVISDNLNWCVESGVVDHEYFKGFNQELYLASGIANTGKENTGYRNSGDSNSGNWNSGNSNSGYRNSGYSNSGYRNRGYRNSGAFCTDNDPQIFLFNRQSEMTVREWENHRACRLMWDHLTPTIWVSENIMTDEEKERHPGYKTTGGYLKSVSHKEMWANMWHNLSDDDKAAFTTLPNFDPAIFEEITGIKI